MNKPTAKGSVSQLKSLGIGVAGSVMGAGLGRIGRPYKVAGVLLTALAAQATGRKELTGLAVGMALSPPAVLSDAVSGFSPGVTGLKERLMAVVDGARDQSASILRDFYMPEAVTNAIAASGVQGIGDADLDFLYDYAELEGWDGDGDDLGSVTAEAMLQSGPTAAALNARQTPEAILLNKMLNAA